LSKNPLSHAILSGRNTRIRAPNAKTQTAQQALSEVDAIQTRI
jgi:hypothetical protein